MPLRTSLQSKPLSGKWSRKSSKRKLMAFNMISLPLADFRHLTHIGTDAHKDNFGDLSFLKPGHNLLLQSSRSEQNLLQVCSPPPKPPRLNQDETEEGHCSNGWNFQYQPSGKGRKKCSSLPLLDMEDIDGEVYELHNEAVSICQSSARGSLSSDRESTQTSPEEAQPDEVDTTFAFNLDLGPSIMDDVLQVMERLHH